MGSQIDKLLEKYWSGETSLDEEKVIKAHFKSNPALTNESHYFRYLAKEKQVKYSGFKGVNKKRAWLSAAATITVGLITAVLVFNDANKDPFAIEDPEKAFEATKNALMMISGELKEGKEHTLELSKFNKAQEELQEDS
ncbi:MULTISPECIES: hypothetical protein [unclassified Ekhidna]|jgi:hypothetical protein|uniref:hypothetical protein n=1 Tax=unclassified Ekhidna TaxID=2632188 RepID=UPI0032DEA487|eukprot:TRINITY_DN85289_c0_g1_i1.p2 TRINITY_DN85289_c0_g1~~TRINITY_DN85289_c0_g1_i1.p2  ORF type:complete len:139 (-),score=20.82 TRINITY_DN85289_c0_g1_i1:3-419(-)